MTLRHRKFRNAVTTAAEAVHFRVRIPGNPPVRADNAFIAGPIPQQIMNDIGAVRVADMRFPFKPGNRVVGHHGRRAACRSVQVERALRKGPHMRFKLSGGIDGKAAIRVVRIPSPFPGSAARPVLDHSDHAVPSPAIRGSLRGLHPVTVGPDQGNDPLRPVPQGILKAHPARLGGQIDLRSQCRGNAERPVFGGCNPGKFAHQFRRARSRKTDSLRPFGHIAPFLTEFGGGPGRTMPRIGGNIRGNPPPLRFTELLQPVAPSGRGPGIPDTHLQNMPDMILPDELNLFIRQLIRFISGFIIGLPAIVPLELIICDKGNALMAGIEHQAGHFLAGKPPGQITGPLLRAETPVLVGKELSLPGQILENVSVLFDQGQRVPVGRFRRNAQHRPLRIDDQRAVRQIFSFRQFLSPPSPFSRTGNCSAPQQADS